jgi:NOL1/NOP2/sun family putative RNA methylase
MQLNENFKIRMKEMLGEEFNDYLASFERKPHSGLRVNRLKLTPEQFLNISPFELSPVPWTENGFYYQKECQPAKHPYYHAGLYYLQEPSAMTPAAVLPVEPGERVLDLCAAPGGKSTELAAKLQGEGVLISNDISASRAMALLKNLELFGVRNSVVLSEYPAKLEQYFTNWFDKILVDAPCSGEGMFRKDPSIQKAWEKQGPDFYHKLQKEIMESAVRMLKPLGMMVYSTCTFSKEENEGTMSWLLEHFPEMHIIPIEKNLPQGFDHGRPEWGNGQEELKHCLRIWPHRVEGEGHFVALLQKDDSDHAAELEAASGLGVSEKNPALTKETVEFLEKCNIDPAKERLKLLGERVYLQPKELPRLNGARVLKPGLYLGDQKKNRFEPAQPLANAMRPGEFCDRIELESGDPNVVKYLKGETIEVDHGGSGWQLVCVDGFPLGFGKLNRGMLKNKYNAAWRLF